MIPRRTIVAVVVTGGALLAFADVADARLVGGPARVAKAKLDRPTLAALGGTSAHITDTLVDRPRRFLRAASPGGWWGGPVTTSTGETFTFHVSHSYELDEAARQEWANFLAWSLHGGELARLTLYYAPLDEVEAVCGEDALACYSPRDETIFAPGDLEGDRNRDVEEILLHEYGHHLAYHRNNAPWRAYNLGPKRWASRANVCRGVATGAMSPGGEGDEYFLDPGEAFAETYRLANVRRLVDWGQTLPWRYPTFPVDPLTLSAVEEDVLRPWAGPTTVRWSGRVRRGTAVTKRFAVPLDGRFAVTLRGLRRGGLTVHSGSDTSRTARGSITGIVCGERSLRVRVSSATAGWFSVTLSRP